MGSKKELRQAIVFVISSLIGAVFLGAAVYFEMDLFPAILFMLIIMAAINFLFRK